MRIKSSICCGGLAALAACSTSAVHAQDARAILKKVSLAYSKARTYQAVERMEVSLGAMVITMNLNIKTIPNKKTAVDITPARTTTTGAPQGMMGAAMNQKVVDDGKNVYIYMAMLNGYMKRPHLSTGQGGMSGGFTPGDFSADKGSYKMLPPTMIGTHPVYAIACTPPAHQGPEGGGVKDMILYVDKTSYRVRQVKIKGSARNQSFDMLMTLVSEKYNLPIPDSVFHFTPPPGSREMKGMPGMGGGPGMAPGQ